MNIDENKTFYIKQIIKKNNNKQYYSPIIDNIYNIFNN